LTLVSICTHNRPQMSRLAHYLIPHHSNNQRARLLHPTALSWVIVLFIIFQIAVTQFSTVFPKILGYASQIPPDQIVALTNTQRQSKGLSALRLDAELSAAAAQKASDMFAKDYWAHVSPTGTQPWYFITESGYNYRYAGENLARDFSDPGSVVTAWMDSPTHRDNVLNSHYQDIGVAVVDGTLGGKETTLVVQMFGTRLSSAPAISSGTSFAVKAQEEPVTTPAMAVPIVQAQQVPLASPFDVSKVISLSILLIFAVLLAVDIAIVRNKHIVRWTSKSFAHLIFIIMLIVAAAAVIRGRIV
jgi:uncharacterized protein YkwD